MTKKKNMKSTKEVSTNNTMGYLDQEPGVKSLRRLIALITSILLNIECLGMIIIKLAIPEVEVSWKSALVGVGIQALIIVLCLFFTTWTDISQLIASYKGRGTGNTSESRDRHIGFNQ